MTQGRRILVVAQSTTLAGNLLAWLGDPEHELVIANTFAAAKHHLATRPHLLIAEVKLGEYNGLHLALRARALGIPSIVLGAADETFSRQAQDLGAIYLAAGALDAAGIRASIRQACEHSAPVAEKPSRRYRGLAVHPIEIDPAAAPPELRAAGATGRGVVIH
jgi:DNA-binding response OmpR family regulator